MMYTIPVKTTTDIHPPDCWHDIYDTNENTNLHTYTVELFCICVYTVFVYLYVVFASLIAQNIRLGKYATPR